MKYVEDNKYRTSALNPTSIQKQHREPSVDYINKRSIPTNITRFQHYVHEQVMINKANNRFDRITQLLLGNSNDPETRILPTAEETPVKVKKPKSTCDKNVFMTPDQKLFPANKLMMITSTNDQTKPTFAHTTP